MNTPPPDNDPLKGGKITTVKASGAVPAPPSRISRWGEWSVEDFLALDFTAEPVIIGDGFGGSILDPEGKMVIAGPPGIGKSNLALTLVRTLIVGGEWLGRFPVSGGHRIVYLDLEMSRQSLHKRLHRIMGDVLKEVSGSLWVVKHPNLRIEEAAGYNYLRVVLEKYRPDLLFIDPLRSLHWKDENSSSEMAMVFGRLDKLMGDYGCAPVLTHHSRKPDRKAGPERGQDMLRGSSALPGWATSILTLNWSGQSDRFQAEFAKARDKAEIIPEFYLDFDRQTFSFRPAEREEGRQKLTRAQTVEVVRQLGAVGVSSKDLLPALHARHDVSEKTARDRVRQCVEKGELEEAEIDDRGTKAYSVGTAQATGFDLSPAA